MSGNVCEVSRGHGDTNRTQEDPVVDGCAMYPAIREGVLTVFRRGMFRWYLKCQMEENCGQRGCKLFEDNYVARVYNEMGVIEMAKPDGCGGW
jgi:hypothetical protein